MHVPADLDSSALLGFPRTIAVLHGIGAAFLERFERLARAFLGSIRTPEYPPPPVTFDLEMPGRPPLDLLLSRHHGLPVLPRALSQRPRLMQASSGFERDLMNVMLSGTGLASRNACYQCRP